MKSITLHELQPEEIEYLRQIRKISLSVSKNRVFSKNPYILREIKYLEATLAGEILSSL